MNPGAASQKSSAARVPVLGVAVWLSLLTSGCVMGKTVETKHELKSGDTVIIKNRLGPARIEGGRNFESSSIFIHWKQNHKTEAVAKRLEGYIFEPARFALVTNQDYYVLNYGSEIWWRNRSRAARWSFFTPTNSPAVWTFLKTYAKTHLPDSAYKFIKADDGRESLIFRSHPAEIWLLKSSWSTGCNRVQIDFDRHRLVGFCAENDRFPKLVFSEDGQFGRWKFDERASEVENQSAGIDETRISRITTNSIGVNSRN